MNNIIARQAIEVLETLEDTVAHICAEESMSGERVWEMILGLATAKLNQFPNEYY